MPKAILNNLPTISKSTQHLVAPTLTPRKEKDEKSTSIAENMKRSLSRGKRLSKRDLSQKLFLPNKDNLSKQS